MSKELYDDHFFMQQAYKQALLAYKAGEVPIGAIIVKDNQIIAQSHNQTITLNNPVAHSEILVIQKAAEVLNNYRLVETKMYVTMEPCIMCLGATMQARITELIYACNDSRVGAISRECYHKNTNINHNLQVTSGIMSAQCGELLRRFFKEKRK